MLALGIELANKYGPYWTFRFLIGGLGYPQPSPYERKKAQKAAEKARKAREAAEAEARFEAELEARVAADAEEKARTERAAKRAAAKAREQGDPETVKSWLSSKRVVHAPGNVLPLPAAYIDYAADCKTHGETPVARGRCFAETLRKLGLNVEEQGNRKRFNVHGLALSSQASGSGLRLAYSR